MVSTRPKHQYRITKYDPGNRNRDGAYLLDEWTSFSDIGKTFAGIRLEKSDYERIEEAYISTACSFLEESGLSSAVVSGLETTRSNKPDELTEKARLGSIEAIQRTIRRILREEVWCRLEGDESFFVHFGWDYYMYIGSNTMCVNSIEVARSNGLFVEVWESPYFPEGGDI